MNIMIAPYEMMTPFTNRKLMRQMYGVDNNLPRLDPQVVGGRNIRLTVSLASLVVPLLMPSIL